MHDNNVDTVQILGVSYKKLSKMAHNSKYTVRLR